MRWVIALACACTYPDFPGDPEHTAYKCDDQNGCPTDYHCSPVTSLCVKNGTKGCAGNDVDIVWSFSHDVENWTLGTKYTTGTVTWTAAQGLPELGALDVQVVATPGPYPEPPEAFVSVLLDAPSDLTGKTISAWVYTEASGIQAKGFATTNAELSDWGNQGEVPIPPNKWSCVSFAPDSATYTSEGRFDKTRIGQVGVSMFGFSAEPLHVFIDDVTF